MRSVRIITRSMSQLRKCLVDDSTVVPLEDIQIDEGPNYIKGLVAIVNRNLKALRNKEVGLVKVQWQHGKGSWWKWEAEEEMSESYPELFAPEDFKDEV